jgi:hypothetical protein
MNVWTTNTLSLGGLTVGLGILTWTGYRWWHTQRKNWKALAFPFFPLMSYGMLLVLSAGGLLGGIAGIALWGSNHIGDITLKYGVGGGTPGVTRSVSLVLTDGGHMMVILMTIAMIATWIYKKSLRRLDIILPIVCGISLGLSSGIAGVAAQALGPVVDTAGGALAGLL